MIMKIQKPKDDKTVLIGIEDWLSQKDGKKLGYTLTEKTYGYLTSYNSLSKKKGWYERTRNVFESDLLFEYGNDILTK